MSAPGRDPAGPELKEVLDVLAARRGIDLRDYRPETLSRRLAERMRATGAKDASAYGELLRSDPDEPDRLRAVLLVGVSALFREPETLEVLRRQALPDLARTQPRGATLRAWVVGCAGGEDAYSLAMLLEELRAGQPWLDYEVIGSDVDPEAVRRAAAGCFLPGSHRSVPADLAGRYLLAHDQGVEVRQELRARTRFVAHDVVGPRLAPPAAVLAEFDLVLCRNVLIYFTPRLQVKAVERLAAVLRPGGLLVLGRSEHLPPAMEPAFRPIDGKRKVLERVG